MESDASQPEIDAALLKSGALQFKSDATLLKSGALQFKSDASLSKSGAAESERDASTTQSGAPLTILHSKIIKKRGKHHVEYEIILYHPVYCPRAS